jgi:hypothetical protein
MPILIKNYMKVVPSSLMVAGIFALIPALISLREHIRYDRVPKCYTKSNGFQKALRVMDDRNKNLRDPLLNYQPQNEHKVYGKGTFYF